MRNLRAGVYIYILAVHESPPPCPSLPPTHTPYICLCRLHRGRLTVLYEPKLLGASNQSAHSCSYAIARLWCQRGAMRSFCYKVRHTWLVTTYHSNMPIYLGCIAPVNCVEGGFSCQNGATMYALVHSGGCEGEEGGVPGWRGRRGDPCRF
jgi:hypothetical protein